MTAELTQPGSRSSKTEQGVTYSVVSQKGNTELTVTPFTTQVTGQVQRNQSSRGQLGFETQIALAQQDVINLNGLSDLDNDTVFGDYIEDQVTALQQRAELATVWQTRAAEIRTEYINAGILDEWDTLSVFVWNVWQHSYHTNDYFERYEEYVMLTKQESSGYTELFEGTQWLVDENSQPVTSAKLQEFNETIHWGDNEVSGNTFWTFDYDQDQDFSYSGERAFAGTHQLNQQGLLSMELLEFYNEGNPSDEGGYDEPGRHYCPDFDVVAALADYQQGELLPACVDFAQISTREDTVEDDLLYNNEEVRFLFKPANHEHFDMSFIAYYELREFMFGLKGEQGTTILKDWNAKSLVTDEVKPHPYNEIEINTVDSLGYIKQTTEAANWTNKDRYNVTQASSLRQLVQVNHVAWGKTGGAFIHEDYQQAEDLETFDYKIAPISKKTIFDEHSGRTIEWQSPVLDQDGELYIVATLDSKWDKQGLIYSADARFTPIMESDEYEIESSWGPVEEVKVSTTLTYPASDATFVSQVRDVDGSSTTTMTFSPAIYSEDNWTVTSPDMPEALFSFIFGSGSNYSFVAQTPVNAFAGTQICWDDNHTGAVMTSELVSSFGGDMVFTLYCNPYWIDNGYYDNGAPSQWLLSAVDSDSDGSFNAELTAFDFGANTFTDSPRHTYSVSFTQ
ncbi:hypothetical protein ACPV5L_07520 [Vibrio astriarenae]